MALIGVGHAEEKEEQAHEDRGVMGEHHDTGEER